MFLTDLRMAFRWESAPMARSLRHGCGHSPMYPQKGVFVSTTTSYRNGQWGESLVLYRFLEEHIGVILWFTLCARPYALTVAIAL